MGVFPFTVNFIYWFIFWVHCDVAYRRQFWSKENLNGFMANKHCWINFTNFFCQFVNGGSRELSYGDGHQCCHHFALYFFEIITSRPNEIKVILNIAGHVFIWSRIYCLGILVYLELEDSCWVFHANSIYLNHTLQHVDNLVNPQLFVEERKVCSAKIYK
jgi:hypothetical protein